ncbi:hypothetical protein AMJ51_00800 [Microgenomates bacterium DG_75]|nr:MAG: hypothetical protein AMJ51_00800 [Microgenomates bacterium DG_75]
MIEAKGEGPMVTLEEKDGQLSLMRGENRDEKMVVFEVLEKEQVPAVFFVVGEQLFRHPDLAREIIEKGHQIGNHTFSHFPEEIDLYPQWQRSGIELDFSQKVIQAQTGYKTKLFRVPYWGAENTISLNSLIFSVAALDRGYQILSLTTDSLDWLETEKEKVVTNAVKLEGAQVILLHDGGGNREVTVSALPEIIKRYKAAGYQFKTADVFLGDGETAMVPASFLERVSSQFVLFLYWLKIYLITFPNLLFRLNIGLVMIGVLAILNLSTIHVTRNSKNWKKPFTPFVSVLVPAYNEEKTIAKTIESLLNSEYPDFEVIVINNNSTDKTVERVREFIHQGVWLVSEKKQGKFAALNKGIMSSQGEILVMVDADTQVLANTIAELVRPFQDSRVGAVAGNLKVGNVFNPLTAFQAIEYIVGFHLDRRAYDVLGAVPVVPGALGAWRKKAVKKVGNYQGDTLTEDAELTIRIQREGYKVVFSAEAIAYTEAPQTLQAFLHQRLRWTLGMLQVFFKHKDIYFRRKYGVLGIIVLPYQALIQLPLMLLSPMIDFFAFVLFFLVSPENILRYFLAFLSLNLILTSLAFIFAKELRIWLLAFVPIQRFYYQGIWYYVLYRSVLTALKGPLVPWQKLARLGNVNIKELKKPVVLAPEVIEQPE